MQTTRLKISLVALVGTLGCHAPAQEASWAFSYPGSDKPGSRLDLRYLNEPTAGETGFVHLSPDGRVFLRGDGKPIRFWPVCAYGYRLKPEEMAANARFLAKMGVNMVRLHASVSPKGKGKTLADFDADEIDRVQRYVAALKKEGIYTTLSPFWANGGHAGAAASWGLGYGEGEDIWGLLFFDDRLKEAYKGWVRHLYLDPNPYTGMPLAKDPSVAIAQVQNEDSLLFWTFQAMKPAAKKMLGKKFGVWLAKKYGSASAAKSKWSGAEQGGDDWASATPAFLDTWILTQPQTGAMKIRADDQMAFLIDQQRGFYAEMTAFYKKDLGYKGLVNACNWITADAVRQNDAERYTYTSADVVAVNRYYNGGSHLGLNAGYRIDIGDFFSDTSGLVDPRSLPFNVKNVVGHPTVVTESGWVHPLGYQAEGPLLCAAYQSLTGVQGLYWFALGAKDYDPNPVFEYFTNPDGTKPLSKWTDSVPSMLGQFPAAALIYRLGYVKAGPPIIHEERTRANLDARDVPLIAEDPSFDPNHHGEDARAGKTEAKTVDPLAFLVGPVEVKYDGDPSLTVVKNLGPYIDETKRTVRSNTGELSLDYGRGIFRLDTPKAQAVAGFLTKGGGSFSLTDVKIDSKNDYAAITLVSLDDLPIATSKRILVQVGTVVRPTGWKQEPATHASEDGKSTLTGYKVVATGKMPWQIRNSEITLSINNASLKKLTPLDPAGYPQTAIDGKSVNGQFTIKLPPNAMYAILEP